MKKDRIRKKIPKVDRTKKDRIKSSNQKNESEVKEKDEDDNASSSSKEEEKSSGAEAEDGKDDNNDKESNNEMSKNSISPERLYKNIYSKNNYIYKYKGEDKGDVKIARGIKVNTIQEILETGDEVLKIEFLTRDNEIKNLSISRKLFGSGHKLAEKLVAQGADVYEHNSRDIIKFLVDSERRAEKEFIHRGLGWDRDDGKSLYFKHYKGINIDSTYDGDYAIKPKGSFNTFKEFVEREVIGNIPLELALTCGFSSAIIGLIGDEVEAEALAIHIYGESTTGKTTASQLAAAVWGSPSRNGEGLLRDWNSTYNSLIAQLRDNTGVTVVFDEASMSNIRDFTNMIYKLASGRDKDRLNRNAEMKATDTWNTTIVSTGEHALTTHANNNIGLLMRILELGDITWTKSGAHADRLKSGLLENYGTAGPELVENLLDKDQEEIKKMWYNEQQRINDMRDDTDRFKHRMAGKMAIITTTAKLVKKLLDIDLNVEGILDMLIQAEKRRLPERDLAGRAYNYLMEQISISSKNFTGDYSKPIGEVEASPYSDLWGKKIYSNDDRNELVIFPSVFKKIMEEGGFEEPNSILRKWKKKEILDAEKDRLTRRRSVNGTRTPVHVIKIEEDEEDEKDGDKSKKSSNKITNLGKMMSG